MSPGSPGARCALHPDAPATSTCSRCGNFMCADCTAGGAGARCPACRALLRGAEFPLDASADLGAIWARAQEAWSGNLVVLCLGTLVFLAMTVGSSLAAAVVGRVVALVLELVAAGVSEVGRTAMAFVIDQAVGLVIGAVVQSVALTGFYRLLLDVLLGRKADLGRMFSQLHLAPRMLGLQLLLTAVVTVPILGLLGGAVAYGLAGRELGVGSLEPAELARLVPGLLGLVAGAALLLIPLVVAVLPVTLFAVPELLIGRCGPVEALRRAWQLGSGQRLRVIGYTLVTSGVVLLGVLACLVGLVPALPLAYLLLLGLFLALRNGSGLPAAVDD